MTVQELCDELSNLIKQGHSSTRVIANCNFSIPWNCTKGEEVGDFCLLYLDSVYYQSDDIELRFYDKEDDYGSEKQLRLF